MTIDDGWRRRLAQERYGDSLTPGFARAPVAGTRSDDEPAAMYVRGQPPFAAGSAPTSSPYRARSATWGGNLGWAVAAVLALIVAAGVGWLLRDGAAPRIVYLPAATPSSTDPTRAAESPAAPFANTEQTTETAPVPAPSVMPPTTARALPRGSVAVVPLAPTTKAAAPPKQRSRSAMATRSRPTKKAAAVPAGPSIGAAASGFACVDGGGPASRTLCDNPTLRRFDEQMQVAQAEVVAHGDRQLIALADRDRATFLRHREKCADDACLTRVYTSYIVALVKLLPAGAATPPICQPEQYTRTPLMNCWPWRLRETRKPFYSK